MKIYPSAQQIILAVLLAILFSSHGLGQDRTVEKSSDEILDLLLSEADQDLAEQAKIPAGLDVYMGRRIAQTMHYTGAEWLIRDEREREERCSLMLANLGVKPGMTICDMGCGNGYHTLQLAKMTGTKGLVFGVDVQPEMLGYSASGWKTR